VYLLYRVRLSSRSKSNSIFSMSLVFVCNVCIHIKTSIRKLTLSSNLCSFYVLSFVEVYYVTCINDQKNNNSKVSLIRTTSRPTKSGFVLLSNHNCIKSGCFGPKLRGLNSEALLRVVRFTLKQNLYIINLETRNCQ